MRLSLPRLRSGQSSLTALYDRAASGWQAGLASLGFDAAYATLCTSAKVGDKPIRALDAGCGTGALARAFATRTVRPLTLDLLDPAPAMLDEATARLTDSGTPLGQVWCGLLEDPRVPEGAYSHVLCAHVIEHLDDPDPALRWLRARLARGGQLVLAVSKPHWCTALVRWRWGNRAFRPADVTARLTAAGFLGITTVPFPSGPPSRVSCGYVAHTP
ncbi:class I SAM-dependent methyltransferase [Pseudaestuariivita atlantica]|uniref:Methyltransferase type 12 n=1 Tax=Pseudaestuariivita atlantica TaxID=1317121 RepID=A0A0L1JLZ0_9RHOB|nr:class I SAM-dependent methyltransferase [Pseudaestuariivita atlantica]KNG92418.1 hypothetical protein ATO11_17565 [Pseudaestuariivita atlantica]